MKRVMSPEKKKKRKEKSVFLQAPAKRIAFSSIINTGRTLLERTAHARMKRNNSVKNRIDKFLFFYYLGNVMTKQQGDTHRNSFDTPSDVSNGNKYISMTLT